MKEFTILKLLDRIRFLFDRSGVDYPIMRKILQIKLIMDQRRVPTIMAAGKTEGKNTYRTSLFMYAFMGLFVALIMLFGFPLYYKMNIVFGMLIFLLMTTMISDFSSVLLDIKDKNILLPRPVNTQTVNAAKLIHILIYLSGITLAIAGPPLIAGAFIYGAAYVVIYIVELALVCGFVIFVTSILYSAILSFFDGEKLKDIINYFQIVLSVFMVIAYQLIGRIFEIVDLKITYAVKWWNYLLPSAWFAAPFELFVGQGRLSDFAGLSIIAVVIPVAAFFIYIKAVLPRFERNLQKLNNYGERAGKSAARREKRQVFISRLLCRDKTERSFYRFTSNVLANERKLKLRVMPSLAMAVVLPLVFLINFYRRGTTLAEFHSSILQSKAYLYIYFAVALLSTSLQYINNSEQYRGAWIYKVLPLTSPAPLLKGAMKAYFMKYILPFFVFASLIFLAIFGIRILPDILLMFFNLLVLLLVIFAVSNKELPFYKDFQYTQDKNSIAAWFISFAICGVLVAAHLIAGGLAYGITINLAISVLLTVVIWKAVFRITWNNIKTGAL
ncbi:MAG TPA: ABC transporter permease [Clostridia bacterium]|nr:ABC transporter permease [Clostridia bacterium]